MKDKNHIWRLVLAAVIFSPMFLAEEGSAGEKTCPSGKVLGGKQCEYRNLCADGTPQILNRICPTTEIEKPIPPADKPLPLENQCAKNTLFFESGELRRKPDPERRKRTVLLIDGDADALFSRYIRDFETHGSRLNLPALSIVYFTNERFTRPEFSIGLGDVFQGLTYKDVWLRKLTAVSVDSLPEPEMVAVEHEADVVCGY